MYDSELCNQHVSTFYCSIGSLTTPDLNIFYNGSFHLAQTARASHASLHRNKKPAEAGFQITISCFKAII